MARQNINQHRTLADYLRKCERGVKKPPYVGEAGPVRQKIMPKLEHRYYYMDVLRLGKIRN